MSDKLHFYLVTAEIHFTIGEEDPTIHTVHMNTLLMNKDQFIAVRHIARAHQSVQMQFAQQVADPNVTVRNVVILNLPYLGHMTLDEFNAPPDGQRPANDAEPIATEPAPKSLVDQVFGNA